MIKWCKIAGNQFFGFWALGILLFLLQELPYIMMPLFHLETNPIMNMQESSTFLNICEKILGALCIAVMMLIVQKNKPFFECGTGFERFGFAAALSALLLNFFGWGLYFGGHQSAKIILIFLAAMPPLYYTFIGLWRRNWVLLFVGSLFTVVHVAHVYGNLKIGNLV